MANLSIVTITRRIEDLFAEYGNYLCVDKEDLDGIFIPEEVQLISNGLVPHRDMEGELYINLQDFAIALCEENDCYLDQYVLDEVNDAPDIYVLSFIIKSNTMGEAYSFHNVHAYC